MLRAFVFRGFAAVVIILTLNSPVYARDEEIPNFQNVNDNILRGGRPTESGLRILNSLNVKTVINLENKRSAIEFERRILERYKNIEFVSSPMSWLEVPTDEQINELLLLLQDPSKYPIFIHCKHGEDRTGLVVGLYRYFVDKWSAQQAYNEMLELGFHPEFDALDSYFRKVTHYSDLTIRNHRANRPAH